MKAGRELDALVADKIMGMPQVHPKCNGYFCGQLPEGFHDSGCGLGGMFDILTYIKPYSSDISAAWYVVEKMAKDGYRWEISARCPIFSDAKNKSWAHFWNYKNGVVEIDKHGESQQLSTPFSDTMTGFRWSMSSIRKN